MIRTDAQRNLVVTDVKSITVDGDGQITIYGQGVYFVLTAEMSKGPNMRPVIHIAEHQSGRHPDGKGTAKLLQFPKRT